MQRLLREVFLKIFSGSLLVVKPDLIDIRRAMTGLSVRSCGSTGVKMKRTFSLVSMS